MYLKEVSSRIQDVAKELSNIHHKFETIQSDLRRIHKSSLVSLRKTIVPFLNESATKISSSAQLVTPIAGLNYIHARNEKKRKSEMKEMESHKRKSKKSSPLKRIESIVFGRKPLQTITNSNIPRLLVPRAAKKTVIPTIFSSIPKPANGLQYQPCKVINIVERLPKSISRSRIIAHLLDNNLVPVKRTAIFSMLQNYDDGKTTKDKWFQRGKEPLLKESDINDLKAELTMYSGKTIAEDEIKKKIQVSQEANVLKQGRVPLTRMNAEPLKISINNKRSLIANT